MSEWKELKIDNLPSDILINGRYEFEVYEETWHRHIIEPLLVLGCVINGDIYRYRKPEPKTPTHKEIIGRYLKCENKGGIIWKLVEDYRPATQQYYLSTG